MFSTPSLQRTVATRNRRRDPRFAVSSPVTYTIGQFHGKGMTLNVSTGGVFIKTDQALPIGRRIQLVMNWPAKLDVGVLRLEVTGKVLRSTAKGTAVKVLRYEFRH